MEQTKVWEEAYLDTRRSFKKRENRLRKFNFSSTDKILDLGCGDGLNMTILRKMGVKSLVGVDISKFLVDKAKKNYPQGKFLVGKAEAIPVKSGVFDVVLVDSVFHHLMHYSKPVKEVNRVLRSGGTLCFVEPHHSPLRALYDQVCLSPIGKIVPQLRNRRVSYIEERPLITHWLKTEKQFLKTLVENGFRQIFCYEDLLSIIGKYQKI